MAKGSKSSSSSLWPVLATAAVAVVGVIGYYTLTRRRVEVFDDLEPPAGFEDDYSENSDGVGPDATNGRVQQLMVEDVSDEEDESVSGEGEDAGQEQESEETKSLRKNTTRRCDRP